MRQLLWIGACGAMLAVAIYAGDHPRPAEIGRITWLRDFPTATAAAQKSGRPVLALFDEYPGCGTCRAFRSGALSHPIVADAAQELFVPLAVYNNATGADGAITEQFKECPLADPVVRILDVNGNDLVPRKVEDFTAATLLARMTASLHASHREIPAWLALVTDEYNPPARQTATFAVGCYWEGEREVGKLDGILGSRTGMLGGDEVVEVEFDPKRVDYATLLGKVSPMSCFRKAYARNEGQSAAAGKLGLPAVRSDDAVDASNVQMYSLWQRPEYLYLPLTALQATKVNAALSPGGSPDAFLSPGQIRLHEKLRRIFSRDPAAATRFAGVAIDRTPTGLPEYARGVERLANTLDRP